MAAAAPYRRRLPFSGGALTPVSMWLRYRLFDWSYNAILCRSKSLALWLQYRVARRLGRSQASRTLLRSHRALVKLHVTGVPPRLLQASVERDIRSEIDRGAIARLVRSRPARAGGRPAESRAVHGGIVLKAPERGNGAAREKGVLLFKYTTRFASVFRDFDVAALQEDYVIVLEPSYSAYARRELLCFANVTRHPIVVMAPDPIDFDFLTRLRSNLLPVDLGASDWVNHLIFKPLTGERKEFDAVMVATLTTFKRHHALLRAMRRLGDPDYRVAIVGLKSREENRALRRFADICGVGRNVELIHRVPQRELNEILNRSKVNVLMSLQEGANRCIFEGFFAGVPGLALRNSVGVSKQHFTEHTGKLVYEKDLPSALAYFREHWERYRPRAWALEHIAPEVSTSKLNELLRRLARERGERWTRDLVAKTNAPGLRYYPDAAAGSRLPTIADVFDTYARVS